MTTENPGAWLRPAPFVDSDAPAIVTFARAAAAGIVDARERAVALYYAVRDGVTYTPYCDFRSADTYRASAVLTKGAGFCVGKAALLAAVARAEGIPARLRFGDVRNHLCTPRLRALVGGDVFYYHGYVELELEGRWVKATPAFDRALCERFGVLPLEFDGREDSVFQPSTARVGVTWNTCATAAWRLTCPWPPSSQPSSASIRGSWRPVSRGTRRGSGTRRARRLHDDGVSRHPFLCPASCELTSSPVSSVGGSSSFLISES